MEEYTYLIKVPTERVAVLIGKKGEVKKELERETKTKIAIDSKEGEVEVSGKNPLLLLTCREIIKGIARGFNPDITFKLLKPDYMLEIIHLPDYTKTKNAAIRLKGRVIGQEGKSRRVIEELTETSISVYGKTIAILGQVEHVAICKKAIESLLQGSPHSKVFTWLEKQRRFRKHMKIDPGEFIE